MERSVAYTLRFATGVAVIASAVVSTTAIALSSLQEENRLLDRRRQVLEVGGLSASGERPTREEVSSRFQERVRVVAIELATGAVAEGVAPETLDPRAAAQDPRLSRPAPENRAGVTRLPEVGLVYEIVSNGDVETLVLPFEGAGLWSTMYGYVALSADLSMVRGITFYEHEETAGLGALITDPDWRALWVGRRVFDDEWQPRLRVIKGAAPPPSEAPFEVDGLAGATLTGNGVTAALAFWLGDDGFGPYLERWRALRGIS